MPPRRVDNHGVPKDTAAKLDRHRNPDGGFGPRLDQRSEPEPTALAAMAFRDADAVAWLAAAQRPDGAFGFDVGPYTNDSATGLCALAVGPGAERERALDYLEEAGARRVGSTSAIPIDPSAIGWGWTQGTASWVEPTARALWALRVVRPTSPRIADAVALLKDRESVGGGWNYGNREVLGEELPPYAQTTAAALIGLRGLDPDLEIQGLDSLRRLWRAEAAGGLSLAMAMAAFRIHGAQSDAESAGVALERLVRETGLLGDGIALGWAALAASDRLPGIDG